MLSHPDLSMEEAIEETKRAVERLARAADKYATGAALYRQAELYRALGEFSAAEDGYRAERAYSIASASLRVSLLSIMSASLPA